MLAEYKQHWLFYVLNLLDPIPSTLKLSIIVRESFAFCLCNKQKIKHLNVWVSLESLVHLFMKSNSIRGMWSITLMLLSKVYMTATRKTKGQLPLHDIHKGQDTGWKFKSLCFTELLYVLDNWNALSPSYHVLFFIVAITNNTNLHRHEYMQTHVHRMLAYTHVYMCMNANTCMHANTLRI